MIDLIEFKRHIIFSLYFDKINIILTLQHRIMEGLKIINQYQIIPEYIK